MDDCGVAAVKLKAPLSSPDVPDEVESLIAWTRTYGPAGTRGLALSAGDAETRETVGMPLHL